MPRLAFIVLVTASLAHADEVALRYNDLAQPTMRSTLERRIESLAVELARAERRVPPHADARLERAATELANLTDEPGGPSNEAVEAALRLYGIVEPPPHLIVASVSAGGGAEEALLDELKAQLPRALASGKYSRVAASAVERGARVRVVVALQESFIDLETVPRALPGGGPAAIRGRLRAPFERPTGIVTLPDGKTEPLVLGGDARRFEGTFHCGRDRGRYQIEITGEDRFGATVLANFPIECGGPAPMTLVVPKTADDVMPTDAAAAESAVLQLVNRDRARAGLSALQPDSQLAEVARAHCRDMLAHGFVGHVSPSTGSAADRVARAKIPAALILENVARAYSPGEVERGLMDSPGHRRNILSAEATRVGVGAVLSEAVGGARELLVTQLFTAQEAPFRAATSTELRASFDELRRARGLAPFQRDAELDDIAQSVANDLAAGRSTPTSAREPLDRAMNGLGARYKSVRTLFAIATQVGQITESLQTQLLERGAVALGIGLAHGTRREDGRMAHHAVVLLAIPR